MRVCESCGTMVAAERCPTCTRPLRVTRRRPASWALLGLTLMAGCHRSIAVYGAPACTDDQDDDGFCASEGDCNDADDTIFPFAQEIAGDGIDSDCDGEDDPPAEP